MLPNRRFSALWQSRSGVRFPTRFKSQTSCLHLPMFITRAGNSVIPTGTMSGRSEFTRRIRSGLSTRWWRSVSIVWRNSISPSVGRRRLRASYQQAEQILTAWVGQNSPALAGVLNNKALLLMQLGRTREAEELFGRAIGLLRSGAGTETTLATALINFAICEAARRPNEARHLREQAKAILAKISDQGTCPSCLRPGSGLARAVRSSKTQGISRLRPACGRTRCTTGANRLRPHGLRADATLALCMRCTPACQDHRFTHNSAQHCR